MICIGTQYFSALLCFARCSFSLACHILSPSHSLHCVDVVVYVPQAKDAKLASYEAMLKDQLEVIESQQTVISALTKSHTYSTRGAM